MKNQKNLTLLYPEDLTEKHFLDELFDSAILGVTSRWIVLYSSEKCIEIIAKEIRKYKDESVSMDDVMLEAIEVFSTNYECAYWENCPMYMYTMKDVVDVLV